MGGGGARDEAMSAVQERRLMILAARRFYMEDESKVGIANDLGISRFKVARLLDQARRDGVVRITLDDSGIEDEGLSVELRDHLRLDAARVVESRGSVADVRHQVGGAAARHLTSVLSEGDVLGFTWGRTLTAVSEELSSLPAVTVVQLTGAVGSDLGRSPVEVVRRVSLQTGGVAHAVFAPMVVEDAAMAAALRRQPDVAQAIALFDALSVAVVAIGSWEPPISQLRDSVSEADLATLHSQGVQAEVAGILLDSDGQLVGAEFAERCLSISARQLGDVPRVIAVAAGEKKAAAMAAVARSGLVSELVTDRLMAEALLRLRPEPFNRPRRRAPQVS